MYFINNGTYKKFFYQVGYDQEELYIVSNLISTTCTSNSLHLLCNIYNQQFVVYLICHKNWTFLKLLAIFYSSFI